MVDSDTTQSEISDAIHTMIEEVSIYYVSFDRCILLSNIYFRIQFKKVEVTDCRVVPGLFHIQGEWQTNDWMTDRLASTDTTQHLGPISSLISKWDWMTGWLTTTDLPVRSRQMTMQTLHRVWIEHLSEPSFTTAMFHVNQKRGLLNNSGPRVVSSAVYRSLLKAPSIKGLHWSKTFVLSVFNQACTLFCVSAKTVETMLCICWCGPDSSQCLFVHLEVVCFVKGSSLKASCNGEQAHLMCIIKNVNIST